MCSKPFYELNGSGSGVLVQPCFFPYQMIMGRNSTAPLQGVMDIFKRAKILLNCCHSVNVTSVIAEKSCDNVC